jgi:RNA polymerase sigma-70 factor (ECF subfamily)
MIEPELRRLAFSIAYRMLGSVAEAEDVAQEASLRYHRTPAPIDSARAYMTTITTRLAIDHLRSARVRRETYVGTWLPEPIVTGNQDGVEMAESVSMAFLTLLETLSPIERAVFLLREVFDYGYDEIAEIVEKTQENCRQLFTRAKRHVEAGKPRFEASRTKRDELARLFIAACEAGDLDHLVRLLATDAAFYGDGGGKATGLAQPLHGQDRVARFLHGLFRKGKQVGISIRHVDVNGQPGIMTFDSHDCLISVMAFDIVDGQILSIRSVVNPDKLHHLGPVSDLARLS